MTEQVDIAVDLDAVSELSSETWLVFGRSTPRIRAHQCSSVVKFFCAFCAFSWPQIRGLEIKTGLAYRLCSERCRRT